MVGCGRMAVEYSVGWGRLREDRVGIVPYPTASYHIRTLKDLDVTVQLQPLVTNHPTFTDFLFVLKTTEQVTCFIEVKKAAVYTSFACQTEATAQAFREAHITLGYCGVGEAKISFLLTCGHLV